MPKVLELLVYVNKALHGYMCNWSKVIIHFVHQIDVSFCIEMIKRLLSDDN